MRFLQIIFLLFPFNSLAQIDSTFGTSRLEQMIMQPGSFVNIIMDTIGSTNDLHVGILTATELTTGRKQRSVCFIAANGFNSIIFSMGNTQIDIEDMNAFIGALEKMKEQVDSKSPPSHQRYQYVSSNLTVLSMENRSGNPAKWDIEIYKRYKYLNQEVPGSPMFIKEKNIGDLLELLKGYSNLPGDNLYK